MAFSTIEVETSDGIQIIRLNRPDAMNAVNSQLADDLCAALVEAEGNDKVRVIILTGSEKAFAAGADIREMATLDYAETASRDLYGVLSETLTRIHKPMIAAVSGYALGAGCELAMSCDIVIAADTAKFGQPEINIGIMPGLGGTQRLIRAIGKSKAMDMVLTGHFMDAEAAERAGLVSRVVPGRKLMEEARAVAAKIAEKPMLAVRHTKEATLAAFDVPLAQGLLYERRLFHALFATEDQAEGMQAFLEKREPQFRDK